MQNNNIIQLPLIFPQKTFLGFFVAFALIRFIQFKLSWHYLLFIVTYSYVGIGRNWSHERRTIDPKVRTKNWDRKPKKERWTSWGEACRRGAAPEANVFWAWKPLKCIHWVKILLVLLQKCTGYARQKGDLASWAAWPLCPPKSAYGHLSQIQTWNLMDLPQRFRHLPIYFGISLWTVRSFYFASER